ncbi:MAG: Na/Pi cotransporter family protein [Eubacterium sp.]|nr:Na/Pi cotransporter family protein [Eubacterium sp.]
MFGMNLMSGALEKMAGGRMESMLAKATSNRVKALVFSAIITIAIQSSSAFTVMLVGFVNSGIMQLSQTIGAIMGSNIGTTLTAWILSMAGISEDNIFLALIKPANLSPLLALIGVLMLMAGKKQKTKDAGTLLLGFTILMTGMEFMSDSMAPLADMPEFTNMMVAFNNPIVGVVVGTVITGVIQSSAASVGILQALSMTGQITFGMAIPIVMGQNIGTCVTAIISAFGVGRAAKRVAVVHILFNMIGTAFWLVVFYGLNLMLHFSFLGKTIDPVGIALVHTLFNIAMTLLLLPFTQVLEKMARNIIKDDTAGTKEVFLDERLMATPSVAITELNKRMMEMAEKARNGLDLAFKLLKQYDAAEYKTVLDNEDVIDTMEDNIGSYVTRLSTTHHLSEAAKRDANALLTAVNEFERMADYAHYLADSAFELHEKKLTFSREATEEARLIFEAVTECYTRTIQAFMEDDVQQAKKIPPLTQLIENICRMEKDAHADRMNRGICSATQGFVFNDILNDCARIAGHCTNISMALIRLNESRTGEGFMHDLKSLYNEKFGELYDDYANRYMPETLMRNTRI